ncbi:hypothetical protein C8R47DRAFT_1217390 [Mycena vitilis]|nr:hypothetical protein C8R47DRAFT_1217390 [Mycena vitilis]
MVWLCRTFRFSPSDKPRRKTMQRRLLSERRAEAAAAGLAFGDPVRPRFTSKGPPSLIDQDIVWRGGAPTRTTPWRGGIVNARSAPAPVVPASEEEETASDTGTSVLEERSVPACAPLPESSVPLSPNSRDEAFHRERRAAARSSAASSSAGSGTWASTKTSAVPRGGRVTAADVMAIRRERASLKARAQDVNRTPTPESQFNVANDWVKYAKNSKARTRVRKRRVVKLEVSDTEALVEENPKRRRCADA